MLMPAANSRLPIHSPRFSADLPVTARLGRQGTKHGKVHRLLARAAEVSVAKPTQRPVVQGELPRSPLEQLQEALAKSVPRKRSFALVRWAAILAEGGVQ
eukprot:scaffold215805_cov17-Tisochrysis_lutea.AAC.3